MGYYGISKEEWIKEISNYYLSFNKPIKELLNSDFFFFPNNGEAPKFEFGYHIVYSDEIYEKFEELKKEKDEKELKEKEEEEINEKKKQEMISNKNITDKIQKKIFKNIPKDEVNKFNSHNYIIATLKFHNEHPKTIKKGHVFYFKNNEYKKESESMDNEYHEINYDDIIRFKEHSENIKNNHNKELMDKIIQYGISKDEKFLDKINDRKLTNLIIEYHKNNNIEINKNILLYYPYQERKINNYSLNYYLFDYEDLTNDLYIFMIDSESEDEESEDEELNIKSKDDDDKSVSSFDLSI